jgi:predicted DNA-binding transcriptional regulator AlpA
MNEHTLDLIPKMVLALQLGVGIRTLDQWIKDGILPKPIKIKNRSYFRQSDVEAAIAKVQK